MNRKIQLALYLFFVSPVLLAQVPVIQKVTPLTTFSNDTLVITGTGFSATPANLDVWFGAVKGTIITSSDFAIEVKVPAQARLSNIEVINKASALSGKSPLKFMPALKTTAFDASGFDAPVSFNADQELWDLAISDLNSDGKPDIVATKFSRPQSPYLASQDLMILQNQSTPGNLSFTKFDKNNMAVLSFGFATDNVVCGDLNGDGKPEIVASRGSEPRNSIHILKNTSAGSTISFATKTDLFLDVNHAATRIAISDLNADGKPELVVTASTTDFFYVFINESTAGNISFNTTPLKIDIDPATTNLRTYEAEIQDFDGDGLQDVVVNRFQENNFYIFKNQSTGSIDFADPVVVTTPSDRDFNRIFSADINNDNKLDLIFTNSTLISQTSAIYLNESTPGTIAFSTDDQALKFNTSVGAWGVDASDIDGDTDADMVIANKDANELNVFINNGDFASPSFTKFSISTANSDTWDSRNVKVSDLDGDGIPDIVYTGFNDLEGKTSVVILRNKHCHQPEILNESPLTICNGQTIVLKTAPAGNLTFAWEKDGVPLGTNSSYLTIAGAASAGTYRVTATNGSCALFDEIAVTYDGGGAPADPDITANTPLCAGGTLTLSTTPVTGATYTWTKPDGTTLNGADQSFTVNLDDAGFYSLQVEVGVCKSNIATKRVDIASMANFVITTSPTSGTVCQGGSVQLSVSNLASHTYEWRKDGTDMGLANTVTSVPVTEDGSYSVFITNTTLNCNTETMPVQVAVLQPPVATFSTGATACLNQELSFTNQSVTDSRATVIYTWNFGDTSSSTDAEPTHTYATVQTFNPSLTVSYQGVSGCSDNESQSVVVTAATLPEITSTSAGLCPGDTVTLSVSESFNSIMWSNTKTTASINITEAATYTVSTTDANGCAGTDEIIIGAKEIPVITASANRSSIIEGDTTQLHAEGADTYAWTPPETLDDDSIANPVAAPPETTTYTVTGSLIDGCTSEAEVMVTVELKTGGFPVAFSPNGDGINDLWDVGAQDKPDCTLSIFDKRGRRIFEGKGENWDGTSGGNSVPVGTYYYVFGCPSEKPVTGNVLILK